MELHFIDVIIFLVFVCCVIGLGLYKSRKEKTSEDYFLAGRGLSWWLIGFSLIAANISAEQFVGMSGQAAKDYVGLAIASYEWFAAITLVVVAFFFLPKFLKSGIFTIPEYLEYRYNHFARTIMSLLMVITLICVNITTVIYLGAKALDPLFKNLNITQLAWIVGIAAAIYVAFGGLKACAWTDFLWGSALILGGLVIMVLTFMALDCPENFEGINASAVCQSIGVEDDATLSQKFQALKQKKMHMVLSADNPEIPWTALILGIWIPNFYYWGLNQYIMQRTLGARSLKDGQRGVVFAAALKLIIPFIVCIPGIIAFSLYHENMQKNASENINKETLLLFEEVKADPQLTEKLFPLNDDFAKLYPDRTKDILMFNAAVAGIVVPSDTEIAELREILIADFMKRNPDFEKKLQEIEEFNKNRKEGEERKELSLATLNNEAISLANTKSKYELHTELVGYDYDSAFPELVANLIPIGLRGFVIAALMGAVVSSLAAMLNAASTIFTMDIYREWFNKKASQARLVWVGRICVPLAVLVGCFIAPELAKPEYQGAFHFIQEFQGYISPGVLTVFLFGLFIPMTPRICGAIGLVLCPVVYGLLHYFWGDIAFLNRMAITVGVLSAVLAGITIVIPLKQRIELPEQQKFDMMSSRGAKICGVIIVIVTTLLYIIFW